MKSTEHLLLVSHLLLLGLGNFAVNGYVYSSVPFPRNRSNPSKKKGGSSCKTMNDFYRIDKDCVDEAFRELRDEIGESRQETMDWMATMVDPFDVDKFPVDKKTTKKWIEKAFDFAFEFNEDFATAPGEKDATEDFLRKSRDWVARMYEEGEKEGKDVDDYDNDDFYEEEEEEVEAETTKNRNDDGSTSSYTEAKSKSQQSRSTPIPDKADEIVSETPKSEDGSTEDMFRVSIDLPGVVRSDVDITLDSDFLLVRAKRDGESDGLPTRMYTKKLVAVSENEVDMEQLKANLKNGVLVISAPKQKTIETKRNIPVS